MARGDAGQIGQVLDALLSNALKYTNPGGRVMLRLEKGTDQLPQVIVSDTGAGLDARQVANLFNPEKSASKKSRPFRFGGLGVGLSLVQEIITHQNGKIWVESQIGVGTTFHFTLQPAG
jgi:signal transduction histidine kinase